MSKQLLERDNHMKKLLATNLSFRDEMLLHGGTIPSSLGNLTKLNVRGLGGNNFHEQIPSPQSQWFRTSLEKNYTIGHKPITNLNSILNIY